MHRSLAAVFRCVDGIRGATAARTLLLVPTFAGRALVSAELGFQRSSRCVVCRLLFEASAYTADVRDRISFWFAREGASIRQLASMQSEDGVPIADELSRWNTSERGSSDASWRACVRRIVWVAGIELPPAPPERPVLALCVGGPGWEGVTYDPDAGVLHIPSPLAPPVGDVFLLELDAPRRRPFAYRGVTRVVSSRAPGAAAPGAPAGFGLAIQREAEAAHSLLMATCPTPDVSSCKRTAPRYRMAGPVRVEEREGTGEETVEYTTPEDLERDYISNLSHGGAFIRTARAYAVGAPLGLHLRLPSGEHLRVGATVVRTMTQGVGVQFDLDEHTDAALSVAMTALPGRARRVLVVDDDVMTRRKLTRALAARGIECIAAADGTAGLQALAEELLSLDAIITDIHMPGPSGDELIEIVRTVGGERDLPIVAVGATGADALQALTAGADAVLLKGAAPERAVAVVEESIEARAASRQRATATGGADLCPHGNEGSSTQYSLRGD